MASFDDVRQIALALPETTERVTHGSAHWRAGDKAFAWERPLRKSDLQALGLAAQEGPVLAARVAELEVKEALIADDPDVYFTTPHFDGFPAVLVRLERIGAEELKELVVEAWLSRAPERVAQAYLDARG